MEPFALSIVAGGVGTVMAFCLGRYSRRRKPAPAEPAPSRADQAITEAELISTSVELRLPVEIVRLLAAKVSTVGQLEGLVASVRSAALKSVETNMMNLAVEYARQRGLNQPELFAKLLVIAQCSAPEGVVHPAFASIESDILVSGDKICKLMEHQKAEWEKRIQNGSHIQAARVREGQESDRLYRLGGYGSQRQTHTWDVLVPTDQGGIRIERITAYDSLGKITSHCHPAEYNLRNDAEQTAFWAAFAQRRMDELVGRVPRASGFSVHGSLIDWTRFLNALSPQPAAASA